MEFVEGTDLATVVQHRGALPVAEACDCIRQAANGLQHAFEKSTVHRDIKPHNLMLSSDGQIRIRDFGLAGFATESAIIDVESGVGASDTPPLHLTTFGSLMATPDYIAPEQACDAHSADIRADIYRLGCTLYFLLTGQPPFAADTVPAKLKAHAEKSLAIEVTDAPQGTTGKGVIRFVGSDTIDKHLVFKGNNGTLLLDGQWLQTRRSGAADASQRNASRSDDDPAENPVSRTAPIPEVSIIKDKCIGEIFLRFSPSGQELARLLAAVAELGSLGRRIQSEM